jgi:hypothetical protein
MTTPAAIAAAAMIATLALKSRERLPCFLLPRSLIK